MKHFLIGLITILIALPVIIFGLAIYGLITGVDDITGSKTKHRVLESIKLAIKGTINLYKKMIKGNN